MSLYTLSAKLDQPASARRTTPPTPHRWTEAGQSACRLLALFFSVISLQSNAESLSFAVDMAMARAGEIEQPIPALESPLEATASTWLAADPYLEASYVDSQPLEGTDEYEIALNLPLKGSAQRSADQRLRDLEQGMDATNAVFLRWQYSGEVRELAWNHRIAEIRLDFAEQHLALTQSLLEKAAALDAGGSMERYQYLLIEQMNLDAKIAASSAKTQRSSTIEAFRAFTGLNAPPEDLIESAASSRPDFAQHPAIQKLDLAQSQQQAVALSAAPGRSNWNVALIARRFENPMLTEEQYGVSFQVPLDFLQTKNLSNQTSLLQQHRSYQIARDQQLREFRRRWFELSEERSQLEHEISLLGASMKIAEALEEQLSTLNAVNELEAELLLSRTMDLLKRRERLAVLGALLGQNTARLNQVAGANL